MARSLLWTTADYQQLHATVAMSAYRVLHERGVEPANDNIQAIREHAKGDSDLQTALAAVDDSLRLLEHLCRVPNRAFQHRAREGHWHSNHVVLPTALVYARGVDILVHDAVARKVRDLLRGLRKRYGFEPIGDDPLHEVAQLAVVAFELRELSPGEYGPAQSLVEEARLYLPVVSAAFFTAADVALADLILLIPPKVTS
jgi:hypothetical protein